ncbi:MAG: hypothetical protein LBJ11_08990 [Oscillospiraceae bacterium]|jgi:hypothetical protein|nr:hypothetical protein [Oscillospiraceae bacterium]
MSHWEDCPACGCSFETKKIEGNTTMQCTINLTGEFTPAQVQAMLAALNGNTLAIKTESAPDASAAQTATTAPVTTPSGDAQQLTASGTASDIPTAPGPTDETPPLSDDPTKLLSNIRAKGRELSAAGKKEVISGAIAALGFDRLQNVPPEKYQELWEAIKDAG